MADVESQLRPARPEEWRAWRGAISAAFGVEAAEPYLSEPAPVAELDRSLGLWEGDRVVATSGIYSRVLTVPGAVLPCAGVTWVTVAPTHRRRGILTAIMRRQLTELHEHQREPVAALWAAEYPIYGRFGYAPATFRGDFTGRTERLRLRPDVDLGSGHVELVPKETYQAAATAVHERLRRFVPGNLERDQRWWDRILQDEKEHRHGATERRYLLHTEPDGTVTGYAAYRVKPGWSDGAEPDGTLTVEEARATSTAAYAALWRLMLSVDLVRTVKAPLLAPDDPIRHLVTDARALRVSQLDGLWVRLVDVDRALAARRYPAPIDLVIEVRDELCPWNAGRWRLSGHPAGGYCGRTDLDADLALGIEELSAAYLGGISLGALHAAGRVTELSPGAVALASTAFSWPVPPSCPDEF
ncbi:MAG: GNAT family N-acetyltransferase [Actinomycetota bacterium]|nr:GNAT family N-acetyltransferase [Actinomycetota bacterium]